MFRAESQKQRGDTLVNVALAFLRKLLEQDFALIISTQFDENRARQFGQNLPVLRKGSDSSWKIWPSTASIPQPPQRALMTPAMVADSSRVEHAEVGRFPSVV